MMKSHTGAILIHETCVLEFTPSPLWHDGKSWFLDIHDKRIKTTDHLPVACGTRRPLDFEPAVEPFVRRMTAEGRDANYPSPSSSP
jgi:hypothetical protein